ncbi:YraN family protein [Candidatus Parcubacteria bacterium]|nr:YraN family protein [Candidatus Parcubacteria bacterium]
MKTEKRRLGDIGENVACTFLTKHGYEIMDRNYLRKWGELDVVAKKGSMIHFIEVKSVSDNLSTARPGYIRAEENMHPGKIKRLHRAIQTYLMEKHLDLDWQLDLVIVRINEQARTARAEILENII